MEIVTHPGMLELDWGSADYPTLRSLQRGTNLELE